MISRITYRALVVAIIGVAVLSVASLGVSIVAFSRQASVAEDKATQAIQATEAARSGAAEATCHFVLAFIAKPGEPEPSTPRGVLTERAARNLYGTFGCAQATGPLPPEIR